MDHRARGIILRTRPLTESSLIVQWVTPDFGRVSTVAKGARRAKSPFRGKLDLFFTGEFTFIRSRRSDLHTLREVSLLESRPTFRHDLNALRRACYATTFLELVTETDAPIPELFPLFQEFINEVDRRPGAEELVLAFELKMLGALGLAPIFAGTMLSEGSQKIAAHLASHSWSAIELLKPSVGQLRELRQFLHGFLIHHLGRLPKGRETAFRGSGLD